jgi:putative nucleotidyltransferase with HDIG domain
MSAYQFLIALGQCLSTMNLYAEAHPARERALDNAYERLQALFGDGFPPEFSFVGNETVVGEHTLPELSHWDWGLKLAAAGVERIEVVGPVGRDAFARFVDDVWGRLNGRPEASAEARQLVAQPIRYGTLTVRRASGGSGRGAEEGDRYGGDEIGPLSLEEEAATIGWIHEEVVERDRLPMTEVEAVVQSLSLTMRSERRMLLPLLELKRFDQYTTTHACNVSVLAMGLSEKLGLGREEVRSFGVAGLLHDIGKVRIPKDLLTKPGKLTEEERAVMQRHPVEGARIVLEKERGLGMAAVVAYEHHVCIDGSGYPGFRFPRQCHVSSRIVHVCDIYDALCTNRPYRDAWDSERALAYLESRAGTEVDGPITRAFCEMVRAMRTQRVATPD